MKNKSFLGRIKRATALLLATAMLATSVDYSSVSAAEDVQGTLDKESGDNSNTNKETNNNTPTGGEHTWGEWKSNGDGTHTRTCTAEGCDASESEDCDIDDDNYACTKCGFELSGFSEELSLASASGDEETEDSYELFVNDQSAGLGENGALDFSTANVEYGKSLRFYVKKNGSKIDDLTGVYYIKHTGADLTRNSDGDITGSSDNQINSDTVLPAGNYCLFYCGTEYEELGEHEGNVGEDGYKQGAIPAMLRIDKAQLAAPLNVSIAKNDSNKVIASWSAVSTTSSGNSIVTTPTTTIKYIPYVYFGEETTPLNAGQKAISETSLDITTLVADKTNAGWKGYGNYKVAVKAVAASPQDDNYNESESASSGSYEVRDEVAPVISKYILTGDGSGNYKLSAEATDADTGITQYAFAQKVTGDTESAFNDLAWKTCENTAGDKFSIEAAVEDISCGDTICFYVKDKHGNVSYKDADTSTSSAISISRVALNGYRDNSGSETGYKKTIVNNGSLTLPTESDMHFTGHTFEGWYQDSEHTTPGEGITTLTAGTAPMTKGTELTLYAYWKDQEVSFKTQPSNVNKTYSADYAELTAVLGDRVSYDSLSWEWYKKIDDGEDIKVTPGDGNSYALENDGRKSVLKIKDCADSGKYYAKVTVTINGAESVSSVTDTATVTIGKRTLNLTLEDKEVTYHSPCPTFSFKLGTNSADEGFVSGDSLSDIVSGYSDRITTDYTQDSPVKEGGYKISFPAETTIESPNYTVNVTGEGTLTVTSYDLTDSSKVTVVLSQDTFEYDGTAKEPGIFSVTLKWDDESDPENLTAGTDYDIKEYKDNILAGQTTTAVVIEFKGNYTGTYTKTFIINKGQYSLQTSMTGWKYGETANEPSVETVKEGTAVYYYLSVGKDADGNYLSEEAALSAFNSDSFDKSAKTTTRPENAGQYYVWAEIAATSNYDAVSAKPAVFEIEKRTITITAGSKTWNYDANEHSYNSYETAGDGFAGADDFLYVSVDGTAKDIGTYDNVITYALTSATTSGGKDNYTINTVNGVLTVEPTKLEAPSGTFAWDSSTSGKLTWVNVTRDELDPEYVVRLYRATLNGDGTVNYDGGYAAHETEPYKTVTTSDNYVTFIDDMRSDSQDTLHAYVATITVKPKYETGSKENYIESDESPVTRPMCAVKITANADTANDKGIDKVCLDTNETSKVIFEGESVSVRSNFQDGYEYDYTSIRDDKGSLFDWSYWIYSPDVHSRTQLTLKQNAVSYPQTVDVYDYSKDKRPSVDKVNATMASDGAYVSVDFQVSDGVGLDSYQFVKRSAVMTDEDNTLTPVDSAWISIPKTEAGNAPYVYSNNVYHIQEAGIYYLAVKDTAGNWSYYSTPIEVYSIEFKNGVADADEHPVSGSMPTLYKLKDSNLTLPANGFTRAGYSFTNWTGATKLVYSDGGSYVANQSDVLTAGWTNEKVTYTVNYYYQTYSDNGTGKSGTEGVNTSYKKLDSKEFTAVYGTTVAYNASSIIADKTGYTLTGTPDGISDYKSSIVVTSEENSIDIYYDLNKWKIKYAYTDTDGSSKTTEVTYYNGQNVVELDKPSATGYTFVGWNYGDLGQAPETMPNNDVSVTGYFQAEQTKYYIRYYEQNLKQTADAAEDHYVEKSFSLNEKLNEEITSDYGTALIASLSEPASVSEGTEAVVAREIVGFTPAAVRICYENPETIDTADKYNTYIDDKHQSAEGNVWKSLSDVEKADETLKDKKGPTYVCFYYTRNIYNVTLDVYKDAREEGKHLFGSYYDGTSKTDPNGNTVTDNDGASWKLPYGYVFASESDGNVTGDGTNGQYKASYFEKFGYEPLSDDSGVSTKWTNRWPTAETSVSKYHLADFADWSTGDQRPTTMPAGDASITREYVTAQKAKYRIEVYAETVKGTTEKQVTLDYSETTATLSLKTATGTYDNIATYERYADVGENIVICNTVPDVPVEGYTYIKASDLMGNIQYKAVYEHNPDNDLCNTEGNPDKEVLSGVVVDNKVVDGVTDVTVLRINFVRKVVPATITYHQYTSSGDVAFATKTVNQKWGTQYYVDPLYYFDGNGEAAEGRTVSNDTAAAINYRNNNYVVSRSGYYWLPSEGGHWPNKQYSEYNSLDDASQYISTVGCYPDGNTTQSYEHIYYSAQEIENHYYLKLSCESTEYDSTNAIWKETGKAVPMVISSTDYPALSTYGTSFHVCAANKCDVYQVDTSSSESIPNDYKKYPGSYFIYKSSVAGETPSFQYTYKTDDSGNELLRDNFEKINLTYSAYENKENGSEGTLKTASDDFYIYKTSDSPVTYATDGSGNVLLFSVDARNQFYNGNRISYSYNSCESAHVGRDYFMKNPPTNGRVVEVANGTAGLYNNGVSYTEKAISDFPANEFQAYYYDVYNDYYMIFNYDGRTCTEASHSNYSYNQKITKGMITCNTFTVEDGYRIVWYMDGTFTTDIHDFNITGPTNIYGRKEKMPVENWDYAFYKLPQTYSDLGSGIWWITTSADSANSKYYNSLAATKRDSKDALTKSGFEYVEQTVEVSYTDTEFNKESTYSGTRTEWYYYGNLVMSKTPHYTMSYVEYNLDPSLYATGGKYGVPGMKYDETNTNNKSKAYCQSTPVNMYAYYTRENFTLTVTRNNTKNNNDEVSTRINGALITLEDPAKDGYTFGGWKLQQVTTTTNDDGTSTTSYTDLTNSDYAYTHVDASGDTAAYTTFSMPICDTRALAVWEPAVCDFKITHLLQDDSQTYNPDLLEKLLDESSGLTKESKTVTIDGESKTVCVYYESGKITGAAYTDNSTNTTYYYSNITTPSGDSGIAFESSNMFAAVQNLPSVKSEDVLKVKDYKLSSLPSFFSYKYTNYSRDTVSKVLTETIEDTSADADFPAYIDAEVTYYYERSSSIQIRAVAFADNTESDSGLTITGTGAHFYGESMSLIATMKPYGYAFLGWFKAADVLKDYLESGLPDDLSALSLKDGIISSIKTDGNPTGTISPVCTDLTYALTAKSSSDFVALTSADSAKKPAITVNSVRNLTENPYIYGYEDNASNSFTASVDWGEGGAGANSISEYKWYYVKLSSENFTDAEIADYKADPTKVPLDKMASAEDATNSGTYLFPVGKSAGDYVYRCVATIKRLDNGRTATSDGSICFNVQPKADYYEATSVTVTYDSKEHNYTEKWSSDTGNHSKMTVYYSETPITDDKTESGSEISSEALAKRLALENTDSEYISTSILKYSNVKVDSDANPAMHVVYYYIVSTDENYKNITGKSGVLINPVELTISSKNAFTKTYDATADIKGKDDSDTVKAGSDFDILSTGSNTYYVVSGILPADQGLGLILNFDAAYDSAHVLSANAITLSNIWVAQKDVNKIVNNYNYKFPTGATLQISGQIKAYPLAVKWLPSADSDLNKTYADADFSYIYNGSEQHPTVVITDENPPEDKSKFLIKASGQKNVGTYSSTAEIVKNDDATYDPSDYTFTLTKQSYTITQRDLMVVPNDLTVVYDGQNHTMQKDAAHDDFTFKTRDTAAAEWQSYVLPAYGTADGETFSATSNSSYKNAGEYQIGVKEAHIYNSAGKNIDDNYNIITTQTGKLTINPCPVIVDGITAYDKAYDGTTSATLGFEGVSIKVVDKTPSSLYSGDTLTFDTSKAIGAFESKTAGENKTVNITIDNSTQAANGSGGALTGDSSANYCLNIDDSQKTTTASITKDTELTVLIGDLSYVYGEKPSYTDYKLTFTGFKDGDTVESNVTNSGENVATYIIKKKDGDTYADAISGITDLDGTSDYMKKLPAGTYYVFMKTKSGEGVKVNEADGIKSDDYSIVWDAKPATLTVEKRPVSISASASYEAITKEYDSTTKVSEDLTKESGGTPVYYALGTIKSGDSDVAASGVIAGDDVALATYSAVYDAAGCGDSRTVKVTGAALGGDDSDNYELKNTSFDLTGKITKKELTITVDDQTICYGNPIGEYTFTVEGALDSEKSGIETAVKANGALTVTCQYVNVADNIKNAAGTYTIDLKSGSYANENYNITYTDGTLTVNKRTVYYKANDAKFSYGKQGVPTYTGAFVTTATTDTGWVYGESANATDASKKVTLYSDETCSTSIDNYSTYITFSCKNGENAVDSTTPAGTYKIYPQNVDGDNKIYSKNYTFVSQPGTLTIAKYYIVIENETSVSSSKYDSVQVLGKVYDGTKKVPDANLLAGKSRTVTQNGHSATYEGIKLKYYEGTQEIEMTLDELACNSYYGEDYVKKSLILCPLQRNTIPLL